MTNTYFKSTHQWLEIWEEKYTNFAVIDFIGWDKENLNASMREKISKTEFKRRVMLSTVGFPKKKRKKPHKDNSLV